MTRILILVTSLDRGGIETMLINYYREIDKCKFQFDFLVNRREKGAYEDEIRALGGRIYRMSPMYPWKYFTYQRELKEFLLKHSEYKIIHSHLEERSYWPLATARRLGVPVRIAHIHNYYPWEWDSKMPFRQWFRFRLRRKGLVTHRLACSQTAGQWLFGKKASFEIIADALKIEKFAFSARRRAEARERLGIADDAMVVGQVGRLVSQKNPLYSLAVFGSAGKLAEADNRVLDNLVYVGKGKLAAQIRRDFPKYLGKTQEAMVVSPVDNIEDYYAGFDVLMMPSRYEGLGMVAVEAGLSGLSVLASDKVPEEANVVKNITFLPLAQPWTWIMELEKLPPHNSTKRLDISKKAAKVAAKAGYDIVAATKKLESFYEDLAY